MELFSLLLNVGVLAYLAHVWRKNKHRLATQPKVPATLNAVSNPHEKRLDIEGVLPVPYAARSFVRGFGLRLDQLVDLTSYATPGNLSSFPEDVRNCLTQQYWEGLALGIEAMQLVREGGELKEGQALYFALVASAPDAYPHVVAFVDKVRPVR